jgi:deoxyribonuclease V
MPHIQDLHQWNVTYPEAVAIQNELRKNIRVCALKHEPATIAGADVSFDKQNNTLYAAVAVLEFPSLEPVAKAVVKEQASFPYIPGLLSFREVPVVIKSYKKLKVFPDVLLCDGQGMAHPRGVGLASHLGLLLGIPSIGCAKSRLCGEHAEPGPEVGNWTSLKLDDRTIGAVLRTRKGVKPVYVSVGHLITLRKAITIVIRSGAGFRIPEPTRIAHLLVNQARLGKSPSWPRRRR